jgi:DNA uptake protein ComE-like DNA-binding protein
VSQANSWFKQTPAWVWFTLIPIFGGLSITYAGYKSRTKIWIMLGLGLTGIAFGFSGNDSILTVIWLSQVASAVYLKKSFLIKTYPKNWLLPEDNKLANLIAVNRAKVDINNCSKHELVNYLGLPIVYANNIESLLNEGYIFTHIEELIEIAGIPEKHIQRIALLITFSYDYKKEADFSWRRLNTYSTSELIAYGLDAAIAQKIVAERELRGEYKSMIEVKQRTGLPFSSYRHLA